MQNIKKRTEGFTIIEVLIVLAIAGLIMLIVLLAVPALQRSQRNTARRTDASRIAASVVNFTANNNGTTPSTTADVGTIIKDIGTFGQYTSVACAAAATPISNTVCITVAAADVNPLNTNLADSAYIVTQSICGASGATVFQSTGSRKIALQYTTETGTKGTSAPQCLDVR